MTDFFNLAPVIVLVAKALAFFGGIGGTTWAALVIIDTVVGISVRSGNGGVFSWAYIKTFLVTNFATTEAKVMLGLVGSAGFNAVAAFLTSGNTSLHAMFVTFVGASAATFAAGAAAQDIALCRDIMSKLTGKTSGQLARKAALKK